PHPCGGARLRSGRGLPVGGPGHSGHDASTVSQASWEVLSPFTHSTNAVHKLPPPTGPRIRHEPSKRNTSALEAISATLLVVSSAYWEESKVWWGLSHPPACAHSAPNPSEVMNSITWMASSSSGANRAARSPPPSMGTPSKPPSHAGRANTPTASSSSACTSSGKK